MLGRPHPTDRRCDHLPSAWHENRDFFYCITYLLTVSLTGREISGRCVCYTVRGDPRITLHVPP